MSDRQSNQTLHYSLDRAEEARAKLRDQLADSADADAVAPYLGTFTNEALGQIVLELDDGTLTLDAGEFKLELSPRVGEDGKVVAYRSITAGLGLEFQFAKDDDGNPVIVPGTPPYEYTFGKVD